MATQEYVKIGDVANEFSVSISTIRKWIREDKIPRDTYIKAGRTYRFSIGAVTEALRGASDTFTDTFTDTSTDTSINTPTDTPPTWQEELADIADVSEPSNDSGIATLDDLDEDY